MTVKTVPQKTDSAAPKPDAKKKDAPKEAKVATGGEAKADRHHATLTTPFTEVVCSECTVGLLKKYINPSLRKQRELDPTNQKYHLKDDEEIEFIRDKPLTLQLIGLRREKSLSNKFDDLLVVLYDPALLKEPEAEATPEDPKAGGKKEKKPVLDGTGLRKENLASTQAFVDKILADKESPPLKDWPLPGTDVSCLQCKHWRVLIFPITTDPGYLNEPKKDKTPDFDDWTLLPDDIGSIAPGIYNSYYRVGLHKGSSKPHTSFAALQLVPDLIPARRRYPIHRHLKSAQVAFDKGKDDTLRASLFSKDAKSTRRHSPPSRRSSRQCRAERPRRKKPSLRQSRSASPCFTPPRSSNSARKRRGFISGPNSRTCSTAPSASSGSRPPTATRLGTSRRTEAGWCAWK